ncbi:alpha-2-macroglobulin [Pusillimonas sp. CC-YST705]|uniref:Alpha-2-macroglobulin n=2 Tax=Mesopusillimonas faecipullorum TaxID=2755040 RepID=A0ABS8CB11_9BURK|nr:alpha-2-macroglobulin [Mesopusillimonas faecipullorum]
MWTFDASAAQLVQVTPKGQVPTVEQVRLRFDADMVDLGNDQAPAPATVQCTGEPSASGRWVDTQQWVYTFDKALGPGVRCTVKPRSGMLTVDGQSVSAQAQYTFSTGGPQVIAYRPYGSQIVEDQVFVLRFNGAVTPASLIKNTHCVVEGLGEQVPVKLINDAQTRQAVLESSYMLGAQSDAADQLLQCSRRLPADADVRLVVGAGVATPSGLTMGKPWHADYQVRPAFRVGLSCQRDNARADCNPLLPVRVTFNAPVLQEAAEQIRLRTAKGEELSPTEPSEGWEGVVEGLDFAGPFDAQAELTLVLPEGLRDDAGRTPVNAADFPLAIRTAEYPALLKFSSGSFGIIERFANASPGGDEADDPPAVPLTVRNVEAILAGRDLRLSPGRVTDVQPKEDVDILRWYARVRNLNTGSYTRRQWAQAMAGKSMGPDDDQPRIDARALSMLDGRPGAKVMELPGSVGSVRDADVLGVPLTEPGFHVLEAASPRLGRDLLGEATPMYVRTAVLVTNLAVHLKRGRDDALVWVTTLDEGKVVPEAQVAVRDCAGRLLASGLTDERGILHIQQPLGSDGYCDETGLFGSFASARIAADHPLARGKEDFSFVLSSWDDGIESWRFNLPTDRQPLPDVITHTVFDRGLYRAGETVHMKHFVRWQVRDGLETPVDDEMLPRKLVITHLGSGERTEQAIEWVKTPSGGMSAVSTLDTTRGAKLGSYQVSLQSDGEKYYYDAHPGVFRIEAFKLPVLTGSLLISDGGAGKNLVAPGSVKADIDLRYVAGGAASGQSVSLSALARDRTPNFPDAEGFDFFLPEAQVISDDTADPRDGGQRLFLDKQPLTLDAQGSASIELDSLPKVNRPMDWLFEASFSDPNGQVQTLSRVVSVWPSAVVPGIRSNSWAEQDKETAISAIALSPQGDPMAKVPMKVTARRLDMLTTRKRLVGGFYSYDSHLQVEDLGEVCSGVSDEQGILRCAFTPDVSGRIELLVTADDDKGRQAQAATTVWVMGGDDLWFGGGNDDRMDVVPVKRSYAPGEQAEFLVKMPFRTALALVTVEREGVLDSRVVHLEGDEPLVRLPVSAQWGPNVYVSVLALRHRLHDVPWYSFFNWGWKRPTAWWQAWRQAAGSDYQAPTGYVDLSKPTFRFGVAEIRVSDEQDRLQVQVQADQSRYGIREQAQVKIKVSLPDGKPAAKAQAMVAVVDEALLELSPNASWDLLQAMRQRRPYGVETATAQSQVVGRRHYGRKALPPGGGGGASQPTRELLDTLVFWQPDVQLDESGQATVTLTLNDSLSAFRVVAVADYGADNFGTGETRFITAQDLQIISGLPAVVREGDSYQGGFTLRNGTESEMKVRVQAQISGPGSGMSLPAQELTVPAGGATLAVWPVEVPVRQLDAGPDAELVWEVEAQAGKDGASDRVRLTQQLLPSVPVAVTHSTLQPLTADQPIQLALRAPEGAQRGLNDVLQGGVQVAALSNLGDGLPGVQAWFQDYPYTCVEQLSAKAIGLRDMAQWQTLAAQMADYQDADGLLSYFPGMRNGSEVLTAHMLVLTDEAQRLGLDFALPTQVRDRMVQGLESFVQGRLQRRAWAPVRDQEARKLMAMEALSRAGAFQPAMLDTISITPERWFTSALIDWASLLHREAGIPGRQGLAEQAWQLLQGRLLLQGDGLVFPDDRQNDAWWLMSSPQVNAARLLLLWAQIPKGREELPGLALGLLHRQQEGAWGTTTENVMGSLAFEQFAKVAQDGEVSGAVTAQWLNLTGNTASKAETAAQIEPDAAPVVLAWPATGNGQLSLTHAGTGQPWVAVRTLAAVPQDKAITAGLTLERKVVPVSQAKPGVWSSGDVYRVELSLTARAPTVWAVVSDPVPAGASVLGGGLGRDSAILAQAGGDVRQEGDTWAWPSYEERRFDSYQAYFEYLPQGVTRLSYTVRLNTVGVFHLPSPRAEALYQAGVYGLLPQSSMQVHGQP